MIIYTRALSVDLKPEKQNMKGDSNNLLGAKNLSDFKNERQNHSCHESEGFLEKGTKERSNISLITEK